MAVESKQLEGFSVERELAVFAEVHLTEAKPLRVAVHELAVLVEQVEAHGVECRVFQ